MTELFRDSTVGHLLRLVSGGKILPYREEKDPEKWKDFVNHKKTHNMARHGQPNEPEKEEMDGDTSEQNGLGPIEDARDGRDNEILQPQTHGLGPVADARRESRRSSDTRVADDHNDLTGTRIDPEKGKDMYIVDWYDENDPEVCTCNYSSNLTNRLQNPRNWSLGKKLFVTGLICLLTFSVYIGSAIYTAGLVGVEEQFGVGQVAATLGLTLFVAGYGLGPMIWSPMSEIPQIGRNPVYIGTLIVFVFFQFAIIYAKNFGMLLAFRFLTGFFGSPVLATGGASLGDMYKPSKRAYAIGIWGAAAVCGPVLGPLVGGFAAEAKGWTWPIWELMWLSGFCLIVLVFFLPETSSANILYRRSRRLRKITGNDKLMSEPEIEGQDMGLKDIVMMVLVRPFSLTLTEPICFCLNLYIALIYGLLYCWFESFAIVFEGIYGFSLGLEGVAYLGIFVGCLVVLPPFCLYLYYVQEPQFDENGEIAPEKRLPPAFVGAFCIPICLFWFGWTARESVHWIVPIIASSFFSIGAFLLFNSVLNYLVSPTTVQFELCSANTNRVMHTQPTQHPCSLETTSSDHLSEPACTFHPQCIFAHITNLQ